MRYVFVPVIGGGGLVAICVAYIGRSPSQTQQTVPSIATHSDQSKVKSDTPENYESAQMSVWTVQPDNPSLGKYWKKDEPLGRTPTVGKGALDMLTWEVKNPKGQLTLTCTEAGLRDMAGRGVKSSTISPEGGQIVVTAEYNKCVINDDTDPREPLATVLIYTKN